MPLKPTAPKICWKLFSDIVWYWVELSRLIFVLMNLLLSMHVLFPFLYLLLLLLLLWLFLSPLLRLLHLFLLLYLLLRLTVLRQGCLLLQPGTAVISGGSLRNKHGSNQRYHNGHKSNDPHKTAIIQHKSITVWVRFSATTYLYLSLNNRTRSLSTLMAVDISTVTPNTT